MFHLHRFHDNEGLTRFNFIANATENLEDFARHGCSHSTGICRTACPLLIDGQNMDVAIEVNPPIIPDFHCVSQLSVNPQSIRACINFE